MARVVLSTPIVNGATMHLPAVGMSHPTEGELVFHYLYRRAVNMPLPSEFICDVNILRHNPWDIVPGALTEREKGKYFFMQKEINRRSNRITSKGFWRSAGSEKPVYYNQGGGSDCMLVGMRRTLTFYFGNSRTAERTKWGMQEFRLAGNGLSPYPAMKHATGDGSKPPCNCAETTIAKRNDGLSAVLRNVLAVTPLVETVVEPDGSWLICRIYRTRQRALPVITPPAIENAREIIIPPANGNAREAQVRFIDFLRQGSHIESSSPCSCIVGPSLAEGSDESAGSVDQKD
uniref:NAC domain-containing protein n=1 Tax=Oryza nivara TaxID=4536 RepID=A0A0E0J2A4_ORYNI